MVRNLVRKSGGLMLLCSLSLVLMLATSCQEAKLKAVITVANKQCPMDMGQAGKITSIIYDGNNVVYNFQLNEEITDIDALKKNQDGMKESIKTMFRNPTREVKKMFEIMVDCNAGLQVIFMSDKSGNKAIAELTTEELKETLNTDADESQSELAKLEGQIKMANLQFPMQASEDIEIEKMELSDESVTYICKVNEDMSDVNLIKENADEVKQGIVATLADQTDASTQVFIKTCVNCNRNITYRYIGNESGTQYDVVITVDELKDMLK